MHAAKGNDDVWLVVPWANLTLKIYVASFRKLLNVFVAVLCILKIMLSCEPASTRQPSTKGPSDKQACAVGQAVTIVEDAF